MVLISLLALTILIAGITASLLVYKTIKCPFGVFTIVWNGLFFLCTLNFVDYYRISDKAVIVIILSYLIFAIGSLTQEIINQKIKKYNLEPQYTEYRNIDSINSGINVAIFFSLLGGILWVLQAIQILGIGNFLNQDAYLLRVIILKHINPISSYFVYVFSLGGSILIGLMLSKYNIFHKKYLLIFMGPTIVGFLIGQRSFLIISILSVMAPLLVNNRKIVLPFKINTNKYIFRAIGILIVFFLTVGSYRGSFDSFDSSNDLSSNMFSKTYTYLTGSFVAFSEILSKWDGKLDNGVNIFTPLSKLTNIFGLTKYDKAIIASIENGRDPVNIPYMFNVFSYVWDVISDFGYIGLLVFVWLLGFISSHLWNKCRLISHITWLDVLLTFVFCYLLYGFVASITNYSLVWYGFGYAFIVTFLSKKYESAHHPLLKRDKLKTFDVKYLRNSLNERGMS